MVIRSGVDIHNVCDVGSLTFSIQFDNFPAHILCLSKLEITSNKCIPVILLLLADHSFVLYVIPGKEWYKTVPVMLTFVLIVNIAKSIGLFSIFYRTIADQ